MVRININKVKNNFWNFARYLLLTIITILIIIPFLWLLFSSVKTDTQILNDPFGLPDRLHFENYIRVFTTLDVPLFYKNTFIIASISLFFGIIITFTSSVALSLMVFKRKRVKNLLYYFFLAGLAIPVFILLIPVFFITVEFNLLNSYTSLILPYIATSIPFNILLFTGFLRDFPKEVIDAATIDGCSLFSLCIRIIVPIIKPVIVTIFIFNLLYIWNEYPFAVTLLRENDKFTVALSAALFKGRWDVDFSGIMALGAIIIIPQLTLFAFLQRYVIEGMTAGAVKG